MARFYLLVNFWVTYGGFGIGIPLGLIGWGWSILYILIDVLLMYIICWSLFLRRRGILLLVMMLRLAF